MKKLLIILIIILSVVVVLYCYIKFYNQDQDFRVIFFNVGQGDSALIQFDNQVEMLVDCGISRTITSKLGKYLSFYDRDIEYLLVTHFDLDHYGGCIDVLKRYNVKNIITNGSSKSGQSYWEEWNKAALNEGAKIKEIKNNEILTIGNSKIEFLFPDSFIDLGKTENENNKSIVFRLTHATSSFLFMGDLEIEGEVALVDKYCIDDGRCSSLESDYLKAGHHGSDSSSSEEFLTAVDPEISIISVGYNSFGHPSLRVLKKIIRQGSKVWRTDQIGDIIIE